MMKVTEIMSEHTAEHTATGWVNWVRFAAIILLLNGVFSAVQGLIAVIGPNSYYAIADGELVLFNVAGWGWWNISVGVSLVIVALALLSGATWARIVAVILTVISAVVQMLLIPAQPWWSLIVIGIDVLVIYALVAHGDELREDF